MENQRGGVSGGADSPDLAIAKRLLDELKLRGFSFRRTAPGEDAPLAGNRAGNSWIDIIHIAGFSHGCFARRQRASPLIVPDSELVERRVAGSALQVLNEVLTWDVEPQSGRDHRSDQADPRFRVE